MIKIEVHILDGQLDIEIKKEGNGYNVLVIVSQSAYHKENGRAWNGRTADSAKVQEITSLIKECYQKPSVPKRIVILDGMQVNIRLKEDGSEIDFFIRNNFDEESNEFQFMQNTFDLINDLIPDEALKRYSQVFGVE